MLFFKIKNMQYQMQCLHTTMRKSSEGKLLAQSSKYLDHVFFSDERFDGVGLRMTFNPWIADILDSSIQFV